MKYRRAILLLVLAQAGCTTVIAVPVQPYAAVPAGAYYRATDDGYASLYRPQDGNPLVEPPATPGGDVTYDWQPETVPAQSVQVAPW